MCKFEYKTNDIIKMETINWETGEIKTIFDRTNECKLFGKPDGMDGGCWYCKEDNNELWKMCMEYSRKDLKPKKERTI